MHQHDFHSHLINKEVPHEYILCDFFHINFRKYKSVCRDSTNVLVWSIWGDWNTIEEGISKNHEDFFGGDRYIYHFDFVLL